MTPIAAIFGAWGFLGRHVTRRLARAGWRIRACGRRPNVGLFLKTMGDPGQIEIFAADLAKRETCLPLVKDATVVINLVGILHESGRQRFSSLHARGARALARAAAAENAAAFIHISAIGADPESASLYAKSKAEGERGVREVFPNAAILRPSVIFGPEDSFLNRFANMARFSPILPLIGEETRFQPVYADDAALAVLKIAEDAKGGRMERHAKIYELGGSAIYSFRELMTFLLKTIKRDRLLLPLPFPLARLLARFAQYAPGAPLTPDQVEALRSDNIVSSRAKREKRSLEGLGIKPRPLEDVAPHYLRRYRKPPL